MHMSTNFHFCEGDRVRVRVSTLLIEKGQIGTVQQVFLSVSNIYDVQFDDLPDPHIMHGDQLELVEPADTSSS